MIPKVVKSMGILVGLVALATVGCKSSGTAVTQRGQVMKISIDGPSSMAEGETSDIRVNVANYGVNKLSNVVYQVEVPPRLVVLEENHGAGMNLTAAITPDGSKLYAYRIGGLNPGEKSEARFKVRASFGSFDTSGDIKVTAWQEDLPNNKLIETHAIKLKS
ncbi:MAG: hypothetical protein WBX15_08420 [Thermoanaerobaculia bacterium]